MKSSHIVEHPASNMSSCPDGTQQQDGLSFMTCGSVDDGKSTLIGRLLWDTKQVYEDQEEALRADSKRHRNLRDGIDFSLLVDGLAAEREQGITIDVAHRYFATPRRRFMVADTPGHEQYTRNMVSAASVVDLAVILVDATKGVLTQTQRHARLAAIMGIRHVVLAVNKMDAVDHDPAVFNRVVQVFKHDVQPLDFLSVTAIPVAALHGDNVVSPSRRMTWYEGPTLLGFLESVDTRSADTQGPATLPVQCVIRDGEQRRYYAGTLASGRLQTGNPVRITTSGEVAHVKDLWSAGRPVVHAEAGDAVTLSLDREVDVSRGDVITAADHPIETSDQFEATLVWMHEDEGLPGRQHEFKLAHQWTTASLLSIKHVIDVKTGDHLTARTLGLNDIADVHLSVSQRVAFRPYARSRRLGAFILVDRYTHATVAAGMIRHSLRRADNIHRQALTIGRRERERLQGHRGRVIWLTGLSGAGKSTLANALAATLHHRGMRTYVLDGDNVRHGLNRDLGFTPVDRVENIRRVAEVAKLMLDAGIVVITAFISPYRAERSMARELIGALDFVEVHVDAPLEVCERRDPKGLYSKARQGLIPNMTGITSPYEPPEQPDLVIPSHSMSIEAAVEMIVRRWID